MPAKKIVRKIKGGKKQQNNEPYKTTTIMMSEWKEGTCARLVDEIWQWFKNDSEQHWLWSYVLKLKSYGRNYISLQAINKG